MQSAVKSLRPGHEEFMSEGGGQTILEPAMPIPASLVAQLVKNPPAITGDLLRSLGWEDTLEKGKATHSNILAWRIPWTV